MVKRTNELYLACSERDQQAEVWRRAANDSDRRNWKPTQAQAQAQIQLQAKIAQLEKDISDINKLIQADEGMVSLYRGRMGTEG